MDAAGAGHSATRGRGALALLADIALVVGGQVAVFAYTLAHAGEETGGVVAIVYTGLFTVVVVPAVEMFFVTWLGTTPGRAILGLSIRPARTWTSPGVATAAPIRLRLVARVIDAGMACVLFVGTFFVMAIVVDDLSAALWKTTALCFFLLPSIEAASTHAYGATPGKRRFGLLVVDARQPNKQLSLLRCGVRSYVPLFSWALWWVVPIFVWGWSFADQRQRGLHDLAAGTCVVTLAARRTVHIGPPLEGRLSDRSFHIPSSFHSGRGEP